MGISAKRSQIGALPRPTGGSILRNEANFPPPAQDMNFAKRSQFRRPHGGVALPATM
jgi:hypothetical protein